MRKNLRHTFTLLLGILLLGIGSSCSTQKNTKASRWWHSFNARYNTYYNGSVAYIEASEQKEKGNKDNYTEFLPLYTIGNKESRKIGEAQYETAITKAKKAIKQHSIKQKPEWTKSRRKTERDIEWLNRREYNPFLWKAWMLMGRSQFYKLRRGCRNILLYVTPIPHTACHIRQGKGVAGKMLYRAGMAV